MKPIIQIWIYESALPQIERGHYPSTIWTTNPSIDGVICINVSVDWFRSMRDYERKVRTEDLPF